MSVYEGVRDEHGEVVTVTVDGKPLHNYDPLGSEGFEWGYRGAGPSALANSILCDYFGVTPGAAQSSWASEYWSRSSDAFKEEVIAEFSHEGNFNLTTEQIREWIKTKGPI